MLQTVAATRTNATTRIPKTATAGLVVKSRRIAALSAPVARPSIGPVVFHSAAAFGCVGGSKSIIIAESAGMMMPAASPCSALAMSSIVRLPAHQNMTRLAASRSEPAITTGRRPMRSETEPRYSSAPKRVNV